MSCSKTLNFFCLPRDRGNFRIFLSFLFILRFSYSKPFLSTWNYASAANIEEVTKFYNLGDKTFETDFSIDFGPENVPQHYR